MKKCDAFNCAGGVARNAYDHEGPCPKCNGTGMIEGEELPKKFEPAFDMPRTAEEAVAVIEAWGDPSCMTFSTARAKRCAELLKRSTEDHANTIYTIAYDSEGKVVVRGMRSSFDPHRDHRIGDCAIEFFYAVKRGVDITPEVLWKHVMGQEWTAKPIDMVLFCPGCGMQHIDEPEVISKIFACHHADPMTCQCDNRRWTNPPHRSHLCHGCGYIWRPADVPTNGVAEIKTKGQNDSKIIKPGCADCANAVCDECGPSS